MRALLDTNIFISYFLLAVGSPSPIGRLMDAAMNRSFTLLLPEELLDEFYEKITTKPYLARRFDADEARDFVATLRNVAELLPPLGAPAPAVVRDPKDDYLLAHALIARADYLVTGDIDLLALGDAAAPLKIISPADFVPLLS